MRNTFSRTAAAFAVCSCLTIAPIAMAQAQARDPFVERLQVRADELQQSVQRLTGRVEQQSFQNNQLRKSLESQAKIVETLTARIEKLESRIVELENLVEAGEQRAAGASTDPAAADVTLVGPTAPATKQAQALQRDGGLDESLESKSGLAPVSLNLEESPDALFKQAKNLLLRGDYTAAETAFGEFLNKYEGDAQAAEAQYWLAESLMIQEAFPEATEAYVTLIATWPDAEKAPDAFVKMARALRKMGQTEQACEALSNAKAAYPDVDAVIRSSIAREQDHAKCSDA